VYVLTVYSKIYMFGLEYSATIRTDVLLLVSMYYCCPKASFIYIYMFGLQCIMRRHGLTDGRYIFTLFFVYLGGKHKRCYVYSLSVGRKEMRRSFIYNTCMVCSAHSIHVVSFLSWCFGCYKYMYGLQCIVNPCCLMCVMLFGLLHIHVWLAVQQVFDILIPLWNTVQ
jgi:hypothetical protein